MIQDSNQVLAVDEVEFFGFRQNTMYKWKTCLGDCASNFGFYGGIRELVMFNSYVEQEQAQRAKNLILTYDSAISAYFRFQHQHDKFEKDEFVDWTWLSFKNQPLSRSEYIGVDIIPNDVCPSLFRQTKALNLKQDQRFETYQVDRSMELKQSEYSYTMSMTIQLNETSCTTLDASDAMQNCNLVLFDGVFMLYLGA